MFRRMKITDKLTVVLPISISFSCHRYQVSLVKNYLPPCHSTSPHTFVVHIFPVQCPMFPCDVAGFQARVSRVIDISVGARLGSTRSIEGHGALKKIPHVRRRPAERSKAFWSPVQVRDAPSQNSVDELCMMVPDKSMHKPDKR